VWIGPENDYSRPSLAWRTSTKVKTLSPGWNESKTFSVKDIYAGSKEHKYSSTYVLHVQVFDQDLIGRDYMGDGQHEFSSFTQTSLTLSAQGKHSGDEVAGKILVGIETNYTKEKKDKKKKEKKPQGKPNPFASYTDREPTASLY
jgi:C2 domain